MGSSDGKCFENDPKVARLEVFKGKVFLFLISRGGRQPGVASSCPCAGTPDGPL